MEVLDYLKFEISVSNVENIVARLSADWRGNESWLSELALKLNDRNKTLRDDLRVNKTSWNHQQYQIRLAYHYYGVSALFNELFIKHKLDVQSIIRWMEKCLGLIGEIPASLITTKVAQLSADAKEYLDKSIKLHEALIAKRGKLGHQKEEDYVSLSAALGDIFGNSNLQEGLDACNTDSRERWVKKLQNIVIARVIMFLEDSYTHLNRKNLLVMSHLLLSLGYSYNTVGIPFLSERYQNTGQELLMSVQQSSCVANDRKQNIKNILVERIKDGTSLEHVYHVIEESHNQPLSVLDQAYISRKYNIICFKQYIDETVAFFQDEATKNKDRRMIHEILANLRESKSLLQIAHPLNQSVRYKMLMANHNQLDKEEEHKWMNVLKKNCFTAAIDYVNATRKELHFLEVFVAFLGLTKETKYLENKLNLHLLCTQPVPLGAIIRELLDLDATEFGEDLREVQAAAAPLRDEECLYYEDKLRDFIIDYFKAPKIQMVELDGRNVLEVTGVKIVLSDIVREDAFKEILNDARCEEVRIVGSNSIHADYNLSDSKWHGKNVVVLTKTIRVHNEVVLDVSGRDSQLTHTSAAGQQADGTGQQGEDGGAGESGGNVLFLVNNILNPENLSILSSGGNATNGQDGGNGRDGEDGKGITKADFRSKFPETAKFNDFSSWTNVKQTLCSIKELGTVSYKWYERPVSDISKWIPFASAYKNSMMPDSYCFDKSLDNIIKDLDDSIDHPADQHNRYNGNIFVEATTHEGNDLEFCFQRDRATVIRQSYFLFKGAPGKPGSKGGPPGLGGQGGFGGDVIIRNPNDVTMAFNVKIRTQSGTDGTDGKGGKYGKHGKNGCDMGYLDYSVSQFMGASEWPKWYGEGENSKIELSYYDFYNSYSVWSPYRRYKNCDSKYVGMSASDQDNHKSRQFDERMTLRQNQERTSDAKATKKKTISQANVLSQYQHLLGSNEAATLSTLSGQIDETNTQLLQSIAHTTTAKFEVDAKAEFTRCAAYRKKSKQKKFRQRSHFNSNSETNLKPRLMKDLTDKPMPLVAWEALGTMHLTKIEIVPLINTFNSLYANNQSPKVQSIKDMFQGKYWFVTLNAISKLLAVNDENVAKEKVSAKKLTEYLTHEESKTDTVSHWDLGSLSQFFYINKEEEREKLVHYIKHTLNDFAKDHHDVFRSFVLVLGESSSCEELKKSFSDYKELLEKTDRGLPVFPESLKRLDEKFSKDRKIIRSIKQNIKEEGCLTPPCLQLLAHIFNVNIRTYKETRIPHKPLCLIADYNPVQKNRSTSPQKPVLHVLIQSEKVIQLQVNWDHVKLDNKRKIKGTLCRNIIRETKRLNTRELLDKYLNGLEFLDESYYEDFEDEDDSPACMSKADRAVALNEILEKFDLNDRMLLGTRLSKISDYVPGEIIESLHEKFTLEGRSLSVQELYSLINAVLESVAEGKVNYGIYQWIILAYPQNQWIDQVVLVDMDTFFKKSLPVELKDKWEIYMLKIKNKNILMRLREKLDVTTLDSESEKCIGDILYILSEIPGEFYPGELGLTEWPCALKEKYWSHKLTELMEWKDAMELSTHSYYLLSIENNHGDHLVKNLMDLLIARKDQVTQDLLTTSLCSLYDETWDLSQKELDMLKASKDVSYWIRSMKNKFLADGKERNLQRLCELLQANANTSEAVKTLLPSIRTHLDVITMNSGFNSYNLAKTKKAIRDYNESDIALWLEAFSEALKNAEGNIDKVKSNVEDIRTEMMSVVDSAILLKRGFRLRDTQKLAVMILLKNKNSALAQVATGEGKSLIVVAVSIIEALIGGKVDIITSSSVLAKRDAEINRDIYSLFGIKVSHNCSEDIEIRKACYSGHQVVYGDLSDFQRDYLLHQFYNINVLGDREFQTVVVDEVDSMLLDKGNNMLYLSHNIPGLDKLESLYLFIWQWISRPCGDRENILLSMDDKQIRDAVIYDLYGTIRIDDIKALNVEMSYHQASAIWEKMKNNNIIDETSKLKIERVNTATIDEMLSPNFNQYTDRLCYLINECIFRDRQIHVPNCLKPFIDIHLNKWIGNAINAFFMTNGEDYVVDVDRTGTSPDRNPNITIIDKDTGTDQSNSQWDEALHQFLQLKHGCKVSMLSLKAVFISNVSYFKQYNHLYGLTGTLGSQGERKLLKEVHNVDFVTIPTAKPKQFHEHVPKVCYSDTEWKNCIKTVALDFIQRNRSVLVICHSVNDVENLHQIFGGKSASFVHTYARDYEEFDITQSKLELGPGHIIIATNLAGRGTDIKINDELKQAGGLHVIVAYLPKNTRIEQQAFGRAARCGEKGSGQLIIQVVDRKEAKMLNMKNKRDNEELERISEIKSFYESQIKVEEMCFRKFKEQFVELKNSIAKANKLATMPESAERVASAGGAILTAKNEEELKGGISDMAEAVNSVGESLINTGTSLIGMDTSKIPKQVEDILLKSCINKWAFWLDENSKFVTNQANAASQTSLISSLDGFLSQMKTLKVEDQQDWSEWLDGDPVSMVELAKYFIQKEFHDAAVTLMDKVIELEPDFSESAHYYKAAALGCKIDWESKPSDSDKMVKEMKAELHLAAKLFEKLGSSSMYKAAIIGKLRHEIQQSLVQVDAYEEQQKNISNICRFFSVSISDILGHSVTPETFTSWSISDQQTNNLYKLMIQGGILEKPKVSLENMSETDLEALCCEYDIPQDILSNFLNEHNGKHISSFKAFKNDLKHNIRLPSKELFWKELVKMKILSQEVKYVIVKVEKLAAVDPSLLDTFKDNGSNAGMKRYELKKEANTIFLNSEQIEEQIKNTYIFEKQDFINRVGNKRYQALKENEVLGFNRQCSFTMDLIRSSAISLPKILTKEQLVAVANDSLLIDALRRNNVISQLDTPEEFSVLANPQAIDDLPSVSEEVKTLLKSYARGSGLQLPYYDSISVSDLTRNRVSHKDALSIFEELVQNKVIERIPNTSSYRLTTHHLNIDVIQLKTPVYENVVKSVIKMSFMYRIALQKIASHLENESSVRLHLKTKPHMDLLWSVYDHKIIIPSQVRTEVSKEDIKDAILALDKQGLKNMLTSSGCISTDRVDGLIDNLVTKHWLTSPSSSKYHVEKDKGKRGSLDGSYSHCQKTVAILLNQRADLLDDATLATIDKSLDRSKSALKALDVPSFGLMPLSKSFSDGDFSMIQELRGFILGGLGELIVLKEKAYTFKFWVNVTCVVLLGIGQILIGAIIDIYSVGAFTYAGNAFISEGIGDIMFAIGAMRTGYFSWKDYGRHKIESVALTVVTAGVGAYWSKGTKFSRVGQKINPTGLGVQAKNLTQVPAAVILKSANQSVAKKVAETVLKKTIEAVAFGTANTMIDAAINNHLQSLCKCLADQILTDIDKEVQNHNISASLERAFKIKGESDARIMVQELTNQHFERTSEWDTLCSWSAKLFSSILNGVVQATAKKQGAGVQTTTVDVIAGVISKTAVMVKYANHVIEIRSMTNRLLDELAKEIDSKLVNGQPNGEFDEARYSRFKADMVDLLREDIKKRSGNIVGQQIVAPLMKDAAHALLRRAGRQVKKVYRKYKDRGIYQELLSRKKQFQEEIERVGDDAEAKERITNEYHDVLLRLASNTRNPHIYADIIDEGVPLDISCLHAVVAVLPQMLESQGIEDGVKIVVEKDDLNQTFEVPGKSGEVTVIRLRITTAGNSNHFELLDDAGNVVPIPSGDGSNNCLLQAISQKVDHGMSNAEFRGSIANKIRDCPEIQHMIKQGYHRYGILLGLYGGRANPYEKEGYWVFDSDKDIDHLRKKVVNGETVYLDAQMSNEELNNHLCEGYNKVMNKLNDIVAGRTEIYGWEGAELVGSKLRPEVFEPTMHDTIFITGENGRVELAYYPVELETIITVRQGRNEFKYVVTIDLDYPTGDQKGPQGPHIGYSIKQYRPREMDHLPRSEGPPKVTGHCLIHTTGNDQVPRRAKMEENKPGVVYVPGRRYENVPEHQKPQDYPRIPHSRLFYGSIRLGSRLQREGDGTGNTRNSTYPSRFF